MSSTRNRNMPNDYCIENQKYKQSVGYTTNTSRRFAHSDAFPCAGINMGGMPGSVLAWNAVDIESTLYGIGSTNLVEKKKDPTPKIKDLDHISFFKRMNIFLPEPLIIEHCHRHSFIIVIVIQ